MKLYRSKHLGISASSMFKSDEILKVYSVEELMKDFNGAPNELLVKTAIQKFFNGTIIRIVGCGVNMLSVKDSQGNIFVVREKDYVAVDSSENVFALTVEQLFDELDLLVEEEEAEEDNNGFNQEIRNAIRLLTDYCIPQPTCDRCIITKECSKFRYL